MQLLVDGNPILFWIIRTFVLITFVYTGWWISNNRRITNLSYWRGVTPLIVIYSLAEGLRWGRATDYFHYCQDLTGELFTNYDEFIYLLWIFLFKNSGFPFWVGFVFYSFILIFSFLYLIRRFPKIARYALPLFFIITSSQSDNLIRQYFALAFIIFAIAFYFGKRYSWMIISFIVAVGIHYGAVFPIVVFVISYLLSKYYTPNKPIILVILFLFFFFFWDNSYYSFITDAISQYAPETGTRVDGYLQGSSFFTADGSLALKSGRKWGGYSNVNRVVVFLVYLFIIVAGFYVTKRRKLRFCFFVRISQYL